MTNPAWKDSIFAKPWQIVFLWHCTHMNEHTSHFACQIKYFYCPCKLLCVSWVENCASLLTHMPECSHLLCHPFTTTTSFLLLCSSMHISRVTKLRTFYGKHTRTRTGAAEIILVQLCKINCMYRSTSDIKPIEGCDTYFYMECVYNLTSEVCSFNIFKAREGNQRKKPKKPDGQFRYEQELNSSVTSCDKTRRGGKIHWQYCSDLNGLEWRKLVFDWLE
jgi:hypothetical protein